MCLQPVVLSTKLLHFGQRLNVSIIICTLFLFWSGAH